MKIGKNSSDRVSRHRDESSTHDRLGRSEVCCENCESTLRMDASSRLCIFYGKQHYEVPHESCPSVCIPESRTMFLAALESRNRGLPKPEANLRNKSGCRDHKSTILYLFMSWLA